MPALPWHLRIFICRILKDFGTCSPGPLNVLKMFSTLNLYLFEHLGMLTKTQVNTLKFITGFIRKQGHAPSLAEIGDALAIRSRGTVHRHVQALAEAGHIQLVAGRKRGIRLPPGSPSRSPMETQKACRLPLLGRIAAGRPIEAIADQEYLNLADFLLGPDRFALQVIGDSMIEAGILPGDTVVVERRDYAENGEIAVALIDGEQATLKRIQQRDGLVELIPANHTLLPMVYPAERVTIQGIVVGQLRSYK